jgi:phosphatidylinositol alpha-mannosyltransferase
MEAFRAVVGDEGAGRLVPTGDAGALARELGSLLDDAGARAALTRAGRERAAAFDWPVVAREVLQVYRVAIAADPRLVAGGAA